MKLKILLMGEVLLFEVPGNSCMLGRRGCDISFLDAYCSQRHALLYLGRDGELHIRDLQSTNGTFVGGERIEDTRVGLEESIRIGRTEIIILEAQVDSGGTQNLRRDQVSPRVTPEVTRIVTNGG